jgi:hypothetical protein
MRIAHLVALSLVVAASGAASAQELATIEVRAEESKQSITLSCKEPNSPSLQDVSRVLAISDPATTNDMRTKLLEVAAEACAKNEPRIIVSRTGSGSLTWKPYQS